MAMANSDLSIIKGWVIEALLEFRAKLSANVTFSPTQGSVVHLNDDMEFEMGASGHQMPLFLHRDAASLDVEPITNDDWWAIAPTGANSAIVATAGLELASAVFDDSRTYAPNDLLKAGTSNTVAATGGVLTNETVTLGTHNVVGVVSRGVIRNKVTRKDVLCFWPCYQPA